ncbi:MAG TPA: TerB family tellurite resistance protein [Nevskiaceae bacterium]
MRVGVVSLRFDSLLARLQRFATAGERPVRPEVGEQLATALLLAEMARVDQKAKRKAAGAERAVIEKLLAEHFDLDAAEVRALAERAFAHDEHAVSLYDYVQSLNRRLDYAGRCRVIEMLWQVAWADGHLDGEEEYRLRKIAGLLYVADDDFIRAKLRVVDPDAPGAVPAAGGQ